MRGLLRWPSRLTAHWDPKTVRLTHHRSRLQTVECPSLASSNRVDRVFGGTSSSRPSQRQGRLIHKKVAVRINSIINSLKQRKPRICTRFRRGRSLVSNWKLARARAEAPAYLTSSANHSNFKCVSNSDLNKCPSMWPQVHGLFK